MHFCSMGDYHDTLADDTWSDNRFILCFGTPGWLVPHQRQITIKYINFIHSTTKAVNYCVELSNTSLYLCGLYSKLQRDLTGSKKAEVGSYCRIKVAIAFWMQIP